MPLAINTVVILLVQITVPRKVLEVAKTATIPLVWMVLTTIVIKMAVTTLVLLVTVVMLPLLPMAFLPILTVAATLTAVIGVLTALDLANNDTICANYGRINYRNYASCANFIQLANQFPLGYDSLVGTTGLTSNFSLSPQHRSPSRSPPRYGSVSPPPLDHYGSTPANVPIAQDQSQREYTISSTVTSVSPPSNAGSSSDLDLDDFDHHLQQMHSSSQEGSLQRSVRSLGPPSQSSSQQGSHMHTSSDASGSRQGSFTSQNGEEQCSNLQGGAQLPFPSL
jgi:hypothetical protein